MRLRNKMSTTLTGKYQEMLCSAVAMGNLNLVETTIADFDAKGLLSQPSVIPAYPNIRCGEAGLTLLMVSISGGGADQKRTMAYLFRGLFEYDEIRLNEANYAGETELDVIASLGDGVSPRFVKKMRKLGAKTACELSGECEYTGPDDWSRFTE